MNTPEIFGAFAILNLIIVVLFFALFVAFMWVTTVMNKIKFGVRYSRAFAETNLEGLGFSYEQIKQLCDSLEKLMVKRAWWKNAHVAVYDYSINDYVKMGIKKDEFYLLGLNKTFSIHIDNPFDMRNIVNILCTEAHGFALL